MSADPVRPDKPRVGISECLLGAEVRYDGGHKLDPYVTRVLGRYFEWVRVCPEVEVGMGTPREPVRLVRDADGLRMIGSDTGDDWTDRMAAYTRRRLADLASRRLRGYVLKSDSPSCGLEGVAVQAEAETPPPTGPGLFARALLERFPDLPVEDERRLRDPRVGESFIRRVYAYDRRQRRTESART